MQGRILGASLGSDAFHFGSHSVGSVVFHNYVEARQGNVIQWGAQEGEEKPDLG